MKRRRLTRKKLFHSAALYSAIFSTFYIAKAVFRSYLQLLDKIGPDLLPLQKVCEVAFALLGFAVSFILCQSYHRRDSVLVGASWMTWMILHILLSFFALRPLIDELRSLGAWEELLSSVYVYMFDLLHVLNAPVSIHFLFLFSGQQQRPKAKSESSESCPHGERRRRWRRGRRESTSDPHSSIRVLERLEDMASHRDPTIQPGLVYAHLAEMDLGTLFALNDEEVIHYV